MYIGHTAEVIRKLKDGVTIQRVLDDVCDSGDAENFERVHYQPKKDIHNIIRDYNVGYITRLHEEDVVSVELLVNTLSKLEDSPILCFNPEYENFNLVIMTQFQKSMLLDHPSKICVDGTHGLNSYSYQLVTILIIDEYNNRVPVAFCFTKKTGRPTLRPCPCFFRT